ncbi:DoxX family protein [Marinoscillum luteum]|uniref:DoxX family protein n=1 Tax=Marinoscillum luteum TaxID=861051 RepID=A0ABW7N7P2_9BACT
MKNTRPISKSRRWTARTMSGIAILFMLMDSIMKFIQPPTVVETTVALGFAEDQIYVLGILGLLSTLLYALPRTSVLGAVLLTAYWGGAMATHLRLDNPLFTHLLFPVYLAILAWGGIWLINEPLRELFPFHFQKVKKD